jgi:dethiobiotin synthase
MNYFVTAIGTDSGKTLSAAILCTALEADYWKPIQAGHPTDSDFIRSLCPTVTIHPEAFVLTTPASPHAAAKIEGIEIRMKDLMLPITNNDLIIEGAGGCLVPVNSNEFVIDLCDHIQTKIILVANLYLGSINHTLLTVNFLKQRNYNVHGIIFNGPSNAESEEIILKHSDYRQLLKIDPEARIDHQTIKKYSALLKKTLT